MARRIINRMEKRAEYEAFEQRKRDEEDEDADDEEEGDEEEAEAEESPGDEEDNGEEEEAPKKKKKESKAKPRSRAAKAVRMKVVWGVFSNSNQRVAVYEFPKRKEAEDHAARLMSEKKSTYFVQPIKEPMDEK